jgi:hypothetical protein
MVVDPHWYGGEEIETYVALSSLGTTPAEWDEIDEQSTRLLSDLRIRFAGATSAAVFGTGPSMTSIDPRSLGTDAIVACNSAISNCAWMDRARPAAVAFGDAVFHFGPSKYAARFRQDLLRVAQVTDAVFVIPRRFAPLAVRRMPYVADRLIAVSPSRRANITDLASQLVVPRTSNVLTRLMLPAALALADHVSIAGCDGRRPKERYFWQHDQNSQYQDEYMSAAFEAHPSFFRDRDYQRYYDKHCRQLEELLAVAEARGKTFTSATPSEIPALSRRAVN